MNDDKLQLVWESSKSWTGELYWKLYTKDGVRFTPDVLTTDELTKRVRNLRNFYLEVQTAFRYW